MDWTAKEYVLVATTSITGVVAIIVALITHRKKAATEQKQSGGQPLVVIQTAASVTVPPQAASSTIPAPQQEESRPVLSEITHREITEKLQGLTPYHRNLVEKSYVGVRVRWRVLLRSLSEISRGNAHVHAYTADTKTAIDCDGTMADFQCLIHAGDGEEIEIEGTIELVSTAYTMLEDCTACRITKPPHTFA